MMDMYEEYGYPKELYGGMAPHCGVSTSKEAAAKVTPRANKARGRVFEYISLSGMYGRTCDEVEIELSVYHPTASARIRELVLLGYLKDSGRERTTSRGCQAKVWVVV